MGLLYHDLIRSAGIANLNGITKSVRYIISVHGSVIMPGYEIIIVIIHYYYYHSSTLIYTIVQLLFFTITSTLSCCLIDVLITLISFRSRVAHSMFVLLQCKESDYVVEAL